MGWSGGREGVRVGGGGLVLRLSGQPDGLRITHTHPLFVADMTAHRATGGATATVTRIMYCSKCIWEGRCQEDWRRDTPNTTCLLLLSGSPPPIPQASRARLTATAGMTGARLYNNVKDS